MLKHDWLLTALIYDLIGCFRSKLSDLTCPITSVCFHDRKWMQTVKESVLSMRWCVLFSSQWIKLLNCKCEVSVWCCNEHLVYQNTTDDAASFELTSQQHLKSRLVYVKNYLRELRHARNIQKRIADKLSFLQIYQRP